MSSEVIYSIYLIENTINNKKYIGFTQNPSRRIRQHKKSKSNYKINQAIRKYGWDNFAFTVIYQSKDKYHCLNEMENYFIELYDSFCNGYNSTVGGGGVFLNEHSKEKISEKMKVVWEKRDNDKIKLKISQSIKNKWAEDSYHKKMCEIRKTQTTSETKQKISKSLTKKKFRIYSPEGQLFETENMKLFCKEKGIGQPSKLYYVAKGKLNHYKGWKAECIET